MGAGQRTVATLIAVGLCCSWASVGRAQTFRRYQCNPDAEYYLRLLFERMKNTNDNLEGEFAPSFSGDRADSLSKIRRELLRGGSPDISAKGPIFVPLDTSFSRNGLPDDPDSYAEGYFYISSDSPSYGPLSRLTFIIRCFGDSRWRIAAMAVGRGDAAAF